MKFIVPLKFVYDEETRRIDTRFFKNLQSDTHFGNFIDLSEELDQNLERNEFLSVLDDNLPPGDYEIINGTLIIAVDEYWDYELEKVLTYCEEAQIPYDYYIYYDNSDSNCIRFYRPYFEKSKWNVIDDFEKSTIPFEKIHSFLNSNDENLSDGEVMQKLAHFLEQEDHQSQYNRLSNWV